MSADEQAVSFDEATAVKTLGSHTYEVNLHDDWCIGSVPNGGYVTSCFMRVAKQHFSTTLRHQKQPHTMIAHLEFLRRTETGPARFTVQDIKLGRQTSTIHVTLRQHGHDEVVGYLTQSDLSVASSGGGTSGLSVPTGWQLHPPPYPVVDAARLRRCGDDDNWAEQRMTPFAKFRRATKRVRSSFPRAGQKMEMLSDQWMRFRSGERFTNEALGFVADMFPQVAEGTKATTTEGKPDDGVLKQGVSSAIAKFWYPTVVLNLDVKKALPEEGVEILFMRSYAKQIKDGRMDLEIVIMDEHGDLVALSHHVSLVLSAQRNLASRTRVGGESKI